MNYLQKLQAALEHKTNLLNQVAILRRSIDHKDNELDTLREQLEEKVDKVIWINAQKKTAEQSLSWLKTSFDSQQVALTKAHSLLSVAELVIKSQKWVISFLAMGLVLETIILVRQVL